MKYAGEDIKLKYDKDVFCPNMSTTRILAKKMQVPQGGTVLDIGCGVGPIAITAAKKGAGKVYAIDMMEEACELARENVILNGVEDRVEVLCGDLYRPLEGTGLKFDAIYDDVSGIADDVARISGWYPEQVPTGGPDGTGPTVRMLEGAPRYLAEDGFVLFPVLSLARREQIMECARRTFSRLEEVLKETRIKLCPELQEDYDSAQSRLRALQQEGLIELGIAGAGRPVWYLQLFKGFA